MSAPRSYDPAEPDPVRDGALLGYLRHARNLTPAEIATRDRLQAEVDARNGKAVPVAAEAGR